MGNVCGFEFVISVIGFGGICKCCCDIIGFDSIIFFFVKKCG